MLDDGTLGRKSRFFYYYRPREVGSGCCESGMVGAFPNFCLRHCISDHYPILVDTLGCVATPSGLNPQPLYSFDANWILEDDFEQLIDQTWSSTTGAFKSHLDLMVFQLCSIKSHDSGDNIVAYCISVLTSTRELQDVNITSIVLIPKIENPSATGYFHPISLCSVLYKFTANTQIDCSTEYSI